VWTSGTLPDAVLGEVEWRYETELKRPGECDPTGGCEGAVSPGAPLDCPNILNGLGGGIMLRGDPPKELGGDGRIVFAELSG
jgi:hypothetical protein